MDDLSKRRRLRDKGLCLLDVLSLRRIRYLGSARIIGERTVRLGEHNTVAGRVAAFVNEICMGIERRREARRVGSLCVAEGVHVEVGNPGAGFSRKRRRSSIRAEFEMRFERKDRSILEQSLQFDQSALLQSVAGYALPPMERRGDRRSSSWSQAR